MADPLADPGPWLVVLASGAVCYGWRALGVGLSHGLESDGTLVRWLTCVSYAMLAAVAVRMIVLPSGVLAQTGDAARYIACAVAVATFLLCRRSVIAGTGAGFCALILFNLFDGTY